MTCPLCQSVDQALNRTHPRFVTELAESVVLLHEHQRYEGWCVLVLKEHADHLSELGVERQSRLFGEVARVAAAVRRVCSPLRINYECLGNVVSHVHWHVVPRYAWDPEPRRTIWTRPDEETSIGSDPVRVVALAERLRAAIE